MKNRVATGMGWVLLLLVGFVSLVAGFYMMALTPLMFPAYGMYLLVAAAIGIAVVGKLRIAGVILLIGAAMVACIAAAMYLDWPPKDGTEKVLALFDGKPVDMHQARYYSYGVMDSGTQLYRFKAKAEIVAQLVKNWGLTETDRAQSAFWNQPPYWWQPEQMSGSKLYSEQGSGSGYILLYEPTSATVYVMKRR